MESFTGFGVQKMLKVFKIFLNLKVFKIFLNLTHYTIDKIVCGGIESG